MSQTLGRICVSALTVVFAALAMFLVLASPNLAASAPVVMPGPRPLDDGPTPTATETTACTVTNTQADYGQFGQNLYITPTVQFDVDMGGIQWVTNWRVEGEVGRVVTVEVALLHCQGDISTLTLLRVGPVSIHKHVHLELHAANLDL